METIRKATNDDLKAIQKLASDTVDKCYRPFLGDENVDWFINGGESDKELETHLTNCDVLIFESKIIGLTIYWDNFIHLMMIDVNYQRRGFGSRLLQYTEQQLANNGHKLVKLESFETNQQAVNFYLENGWVMVKSQREENLNLNRVFFEKRIS